MFQDEKRERAMSVDHFPPRAIAASRVRAAADRYEYKHKLSKNERLCDFLDWMAREAPYALVPANFVVRAIDGQAKMPRDGTEETKKARARASTCRALMGERHKRGIVVDPAGIRATVDEDDTMRSQQVRNVRRLQTAVASVRRTDDIVPTEKLRDPELRSWKAGVRGALKAIDSDKRIFALIPAQLGPKKE